MIDLRPIIARKRDGAELSADEIKAFVSAAGSGEASEVQLASLLMAILKSGCSIEERASYVREMIASGDTLDTARIQRPVVDKHSTGGVGDKVSIPLAPLLAAAGMAVPMISGRGLGHTGGTLDKLESIPGFRTDLDADRIVQLADEVGCCITGQTPRLCPADRILYDLRSRTATVESIDHIVASIMSKKLAEGLDHLVLDVKVGEGAFMKRAEDARALAQALVDTGRAAGCRTTALITDMNRPLGHAVGNGIEVVESLHLLHGRGAPDTRGLVIELASMLSVSAGLDPDLSTARRRMAGLIASGAALARFQAMVVAQGGDPSTLVETERLLGPERPTITTVPAWATGRVVAMSALSVGRAAAAVGGGRGADGAAPDPGVGVWIEQREGEVVDEGQPLFRLFHRGSGMEEAIEHLRQSCRIEVDGPMPPRLVQERLS